MVCVVALLVSIAALVVACASFYWTSPAPAQVELDHIAQPDELVPDDLIGAVFDVMGQAGEHVFQVLTKRPERMADFCLGRGEPAPNVWLGTLIENNRWAGRADALRRTPAAVRFLSAEPSLGPLDRLEVDGLDWLIVGGESGEGYRAVEAEWVRDLRDRSLAAGVPFFFKQWGGRTPKAGGRSLDGRVWNEMPQLPSGPPSLFD